MAITETSICNTALVNLGLERINSLSEENKKGVLCREQYPKARDLVLAAHKWNFALKRAELSQIDEDVSWGFSYQYQLPSDCLRVVAVEDQNPYKIEGGRLLTESDEVFVLYIARITNTALFPPNFADAVSFRLAAELAYPLVQSRELSKDMRDVYMSILREARSVDGQEGTPDDLVADDFLNARL